MRRGGRFAFGAGAWCLASALAAPAGAQTAPPAPSAPPAAAPDEEPDEIVVRGVKPYGAVIGDIQPEVSFTPGDIRSFGVSSIEDLIAEVAPQTTSGQGRGGESPVVLLNGKRISSFSEVRDIPTEAIMRLEVLPEEVGLKYGYTANQKVINIVLRRRFRAVTAEAEGAAPTAGGQFSPDGDAGLFRIRGDTRFTVTGKAQHSSDLTESERDITAQLPRQPYDLTGNITSATPGAEIDPALSALLGRPATVVGVPLSAATTAPTLADFAAGGGAQNVSDLGRARTLLPRTTALSLNSVLARSLGGVSATMNGTLGYNTSDSLQGLAGARIGLPAANPFSPFAGDTTLYRYLGEGGPLGQRERDWSGHLGTTLTGQVAKWNWTFTGNYDHAQSHIDTDRGFDLTAYQARIDALDPTLDPFAPLTRDALAGRLTDYARSVSNTGDAELVVTGSAFSLPAGPVTSTFKLGGTYAVFDASSIRSGVTALSDLSRSDVSGQFSVDLPIASARKGVLSPLGELSANVNIAYDGLSDFGILRTLGGGLHWTPIKPVSLIASVTKDEGAPTVQQLGDPLVATTGVRVFDYVRGQTVDITRLAGGNPTLTADDRRVFKLGLTVKPLARQDLTLTADYVDSRVKNPIASFPTATAAIEAAFPDRFTRDASGQLLQIDSRPINFAEQDQQQIRWGINFSKQLKAPPRPSGTPGTPSLRSLLPQGQSGDQPPGSRNGPGGGGRQGGGGGFGRGNFGRGTRLQFAVYHTIYLKDDILVHDGGPRLDLLHGDAIGSSGGQPRQEVQVQAGVLHNGLGARASLSWQSATTVDGGPGNAEMLRFSDLTTVNLRLFADLGTQRAWVERHPFLRGARVTLAVTNLFNKREQVRDANGDTPISYQPDYLDPLGRSVKITFRKLFFPRPPGRG